MQIWLDNSTPARLKDRGERWTATFSKAKTDSDGEAQIAPKATPARRYLAGPNVGCTSQFSIDRRHNLVRVRERQTQRPLKDAAARAADRSDQLRHRCLGRRPRISHKSHHRSMENDRYLATSAGSVASITHAGRPRDRAPTMGGRTAPIQDRRKPVERPSASRTTAIGLNNPHYTPGRTNSTITLLNLSWNLKQWR